MVRPTPPSDWVVYIVVIATVAALLFGKFLIFFNDKEAKESETEQLEDTVEEIIEETLDEKIK